MTNRSYLNDAHSIYWKHISTHPHNCFPHTNTRPKMHLFPRKSRQFTSEPASTPSGRLNAQQAGLSNIVRSVMAKEEHPQISVTSAGVPSHDPIEVLIIENATAMVTNAHSSKTQSEFCCTGCGLTGKFSVVSNSNGEMTQQLQTMEGHQEIDGRQGYFQPADTVNENQRRRRTLNKNSPTFFSRGSNARSSISMDEMGSSDRNLLLFIFCATGFYWFSGEYSLLETIDVGAS